MTHMSGAGSRLQQLANQAASSKAPFGVIEQFASWWRIACFLIVLLAYWGYSVGSTLMFIRYRKDYYIAKRGFWALIWCAVLQLLHITIVLSRQINRARFPAFLLLWANNVILPMFLCCAYVVRPFSLLHEYYWNDHKFHGISKSGLIAQEKISAFSGAIADGVPRSASPYSRKCSLISAISGYSQQQAVYMQEVEKPWWKRAYFWFILDKKCNQNLLISLFCIHFLVTLLVQIRTSEYRIFSIRQYGAVMSKGELTPNYVSLILYTFVFSPGVLRLLVGVEDAFGIKEDAICSIYVGIPLYAFFLFWRHTTCMTHFQEYLPSFWFIVFGLVLFQTYMIVRPVLHVMHQRKIRGRGPLEKTALSSITLQTALTDSVLLCLLRKFLVLEFSVENIIFWEVVQEFKSLFQDQTLHQPAAINSIPNEAKEKTAKDIWETFFVLTSKYALNLPESIKQAVEQRVFSQPIDANTFRLAEREVRQIMETYSFPRFLKYIHENDLETIPHFKSLTLKNIQYPVP